MTEEAQQFELVRKLEDDIWLAIRTTNGEHFLAKRVGDFEEYFIQAREEEVFGYTTRKQRRVKGLYDLIYEHNLGRAVSHFFNHENLVSLAGHLRHQPLVRGPFDPSQPTEDYLIWDDCDGGNLELLLVNKTPLRPPLLRSFMPESLCWHVLTSVMRAFAWIHDGYRQEVDWDSGSHRWVKTDVDWMPVLHRDVRATTIMFQQPRGEETYGPCKLAQFGNAFVSGVAADRHEPNEFVTLQERHFYNGAGEVIAPHAAAPPGTKNSIDASVKEMRKTWRDLVEMGESDKVIYTISHEHWALGAVLFRMMTARYLPSREICQSCPNKCRHVRICELDPPCLLAKTAVGRGGDGDFSDDDEDVEMAEPSSPGADERTKCKHAYAGCTHVRAALAAGHRCTHNVWQSGCCCDPPCRAVPDFNIDDVLAEQDYSRHLVLAVRRLFGWRFQGDEEIAQWYSPARGSKKLCEEIERLYRSWKTETEEGREYIDVRDDARKRYLLLNGKPVPEELCAGGIF